MEHAMEAKIRQKKSFSEGKFSVLEKSLKTFVGNGRITFECVLLRGNFK